MGGFAGDQSLYPSIGLLHGVGESAAKGEDSVVAQDEEQIKLTQGLMQRLLDKFPNASPGALERLAEEAKTNPLSVAAVPADWTSMVIDPDAAATASNARETTAREASLRQAQAHAEGAQNLTLAAVQQRMNEAMQLMQQSTMQNIYSNGYDLQASQQAVYNPSQNYLYSTRTFSPAPTQANISPPAPVTPKPLEIAAPAGKRAFMLDEES